jgi:hypothetical protein
MYESVSDKLPLVESPRKESSRETSGQLKFVDHQGRENG